MEHEDTKTRGYEIIKSEDRMDKGHKSLEKGESEENGANARNFYR